MSYFKYLMVAVSLILATSLSSTASAGLFDLLGPSSEEKQEYQKLVVDQMKKDLHSLDATVKILDYEYVDNKPIDFTNGENGKIVMTVLKVTNSDDEQYYLLTTTLLRMDNNDLVYDDHLMTFLEIDGFTRSKRDETFKNYVDKMLYSLELGGRIFASTS